MKRRHGYTLIEMMVVLAVGSVLSGVAVALIVALLRSESGARDHIHQSAVQSRLADQFRRDVHAADAIDADDSGLVWTFTLGRGRTVTYRIEANRLERSETAEKDTQRQETYALPPDHTARLDMPEPADSPIVGLSIIPTAKTLDAKPRATVRFEALLAADHRYEISTDAGNDEETAEEGTDG